MGGFQMAEARSVVSQSKAQMNAIIHVLGSISECRNF